MALGNMRELGVHHLIAHCLRMTYWPKLVSMMDRAESQFGLWAAIPYPRQSQSPLVRSTNTLTPSDRLPRNNCGADVTQRFCGCRNTGGPGNRGALASCGSG